MLMGGKPFTIFRMAISLANGVVLHLSQVESSFQLSEPPLSVSLGGSGCVFSHEVATNIPVYPLEVMPSVGIVSVGVISYSLGGEILRLSPKPL